MKRALSFLVLCSFFLTAQRAQAQTSLPDTLDTRTHPVRTLGEITLVNTVVWSYNRFLRPGGGSGFKVGWHSWNESFENGFDWDPNNFSTNQFAHPYHGGLYYNAARSNGYDYWASMGFSFVGSFQWEYFGETHHPSFNDWVNTSVGGTALGEITHRFGSRVRDNTATGSSRVWSEFGGFLIDPVGGFTRLIDGDAFKQMPNPADREEGARVRVVGTFGSRTTYEGEIPHADTTAFCAQLRFDWGDPFQAEFERPYDYFGAYVRINGSDIATLGQVDVAGMLMRKRLAEGQNSQHMFAVFQNYDYLNNRAFELGGQSATASLMSRFGASEARYKVNTTVGVTGILLGATKSDYANQTSRSYDYGPGYGARFRGALTRDDWELLRVSHEEFVIHSVNGNKGDHYLSISTAGVSLPVSKVFVLDAEYQLYLADRHYSQFPDVHQRSPQLLFGVKTRL